MPAQKKIRWSLIYRQAALKLLISEKLHDAGTDVTKAVLPELLSQVCQRHVTPTLRLAPRVDCWMEAACCQVSQGKGQLDGMLL